MRAKVPQIKNEGWCDTCIGPRYETCEHTVPTRNFISFTTKRTYRIRSENLNCMFMNVV